VYVNSVRCSYKGGRAAIERYLKAHDIIVDGVVTIKPIACIYVDDRGLQFHGDWEQTIGDIERFSNWCKSKADKVYVKNDADHEYDRIWAHNNQIADEVINGG
jgi:hypothetical protein